MHRGRSLKVEESTNKSNMNHAEGQVHTGSSQLPFKTIIRPFSPRNRAKSATSIKGFTKGFGHDLAYDAEGGVKSGSFKKSKSTDLLNRRRTLSGLNMSALVGGRVASSGEDGTHCAVGSSSMTGGVGLKPSRKKTTKSVLELHEIVSNDEMTADEEVEYFTEEDDEQQQQLLAKDKLISNKKSGVSQRPQNLHMNSSNDVMLLKLTNSPTKSSSTNTVQKERKDTDLIQSLQPSYKQPSKLLKKSSKEELVPNPELSVHLENSDHIDNLTDSDIDESDDEDNISQLDKDDHISRIPSSHELKETTEHSLKRHKSVYSDIRNAKKTGSESNGDKSSSSSLEGDGSLSKEENMDQILPDLIPPQEDDKKDCIKPNELTKTSLIKNESPDQIPNVVPEFAEPNPEVTLNIPTPFKPEQKSYFKNFQSSPAFQNSISSLTSNLQKSTLDSLYRKGSPKNDPNIDDKLSDLPNKIKHKPSPLNLKTDINEHNTGSSNSQLKNFNNFSEFLESNNTDTGSRTQKKLWLQRENSIMDLSSQNEETGFFFMSGNIAAKREFEKITHEYINVRRFNNPIADSLMRINSNERPNNKTRASKKLDSNVNSVLYPNYNNHDALSSYMPSSEYATLKESLFSMWKEETISMNKLTNPLEKNRLTNNGHYTQPTRQNVRGPSNSGQIYHHQRNINSMQPTTRAVNRRMENTAHTQNR